MIIDSHCHLTYEPMVNSLEETINRANKDGVKFFLTISTVDKSFDKILTILKNYKCVFGSYGIHPHEAKNHTEIKSKDIINRVNKDKKIIGIGESGLDFYYNYSDKNDQINSFLEHIDASQKTQLPLIVHTRSAEEETLKILREAKIKKDFKILIHCFTGSKKFAFDLLDLGAYIPDNRILVETDSPYLAPVPLRGKPNEPSYIVHTVEFLSKLKNISYDDFAKITTQNFFKLFGELN